MNLFVYGTLAPGEPNEHILEGVQGEWKEGTITGQLFESGWGAALGYPGIILDPQGKKVNGQLFCSRELHAHWERLDEFEGEGYQRVLTSVLLEDGSVEEAFVYELSAAGRNVYTRFSFVEVS